MSKELNLLSEEFVESEVLCNKSRQIYNALEDILIRKDYMQNKDCLASQSGERKPKDSATNSYHNLVKNNSTHKIKPNCSENYINLKKCSHPTTPDNKNCFVTLQNKIHEFESYKNSVSQVHNKYASEFLSLLETQNEKLSSECFENKSDSS